MAERRMFSKQIIDSDAFLDMPLSAQALYFHLSMRADDEGFVNNPKKIQRMVGASDDDCKLLVLKRFILTFDSGFIVIKHWRIHNYIRSDRFKETVHVKEKATLSLNENHAYTERVDECHPFGIPSDNQAVDSWDTQDRLGKDRLDKKERKKEIYINNNQDTYACEDDGFKSHEEVMDEFGLSNQLKEYLKGFLRHCYLNKHIVSNDKLESIIFRLLDDLDSDKERIECIERAISGGYVDIKT